MKDCKVRSPVFQTLQILMLWEEYLVHTRLRKLNINWQLWKSHPMHEALSDTFSKIGIFLPTIFHGFLFSNYSPMSVHSWCIPPRKLMYVCVRGAPSGLDNVSVSIDWGCEAEGRQKIEHGRDKRCRFERTGGGGIGRWAEEEWDSKHVLREKCEQGGRRGLYICINCWGPGRVLRGSGRSVIFGWKLTTENQLIPYLQRRVLPLAHQWEFTGYMVLEQTCSHGVSLWVFLIIDL